MTSTAWSWGISRSRVSLSSTSPRGNHFGNRSFTAPTKARANASGSSRGEGCGSLVTLREYGSTRRGRRFGGEEDGSKQVVATLEVIGWPGDANLHAHRRMISGR